VALAGCTRNPALRYRDVDTGVVQVEVRYENMQECLCSVHSMLDVLNILRRRVSPSVGGLVVCAF
jgi:hypothetical protein